MDGQLGAITGDPEVGVLDVDRDDLAGVDASDPQALAGDPYDAVSGDLALHADRTGRWGRQLAGGDPGAADLDLPTGPARGVGGDPLRPICAPLIGGDRRGQRLGVHVVVHDVDEVSVEAEHDFASGEFGTDFRRYLASSALPLLSTMRPTSITVAAGR